jgi:sulfite exporter TauE/SafE
VTSAATAQLITAFALGLVGSGHCAVVCGPLLAAHLGARTSEGVHARAAPCGTRAAVQRVLALSAGRIAMYMLLAAVVAAVGHGLGAVTGIATALRVVAALLMIGIGCHLLGWSRAVLTVEGSVRAALMRVAHAGQVRAAGHPQSTVLFAGLVWGAMPCGMAYTVVLWAGLSANAGLAPLMMFAFGLGTLPALVTTGLVAARLRRGLRHARVLAGGALVVLGVFMLPGMQALAERHAAPMLPAELQGFAALCGSSMGLVR